MGEAGDTSFGVVDRRAQRANCAAEDTGGGAGTADAGSDAGRGAARHRQVTRAIAVDGATEGGSTDSADVAHVGAAREDRTREGAQRRTAGGGDRRTRGTTVASRNEARRDREADRAPEALVDDVGTAALDRGEGGRHRLNCFHLELGRGEPDLRGQRLGMGGAAGESLNDELVGGDIDVVRCNARLGRARGEGLRLGDIHVVKRQLGLFKLGEAVGHDYRRGASSGYLGGQGFVSDTDIERGAVLGDPSAGERVARRAAQLLDDLGGLEVPGDTSSGLLGVQPQVALHGVQDLRVEAGRGLRGCTVGKGQDDCQEGEESSELHDWRSEDKT